MQEGGQSFDVSAQQFDLLSLRTFRRDTILQYDATNQSEPLRIALCFLGVLFSLCIPTLFDSSYDALTANVAALIGTGISGTLFQRNRSARSARMGKIDLEYQMGDLNARYRGVRTQKLSELRQKRRVVALVGPRATIEPRIQQARVYRRRLSGADAVVVPVYSDRDGATDAAVAAVGEAESRWLWAAADTAAWLGYFESLLSVRSMDVGRDGAWLGLNFKGRSFGSALGAPRWDELLGTALQPSGDGFGELKEAGSMSLDEAAAEAAAAAVAVAGSGRADAAALAAATDDARSLLDAQDRFYAALTSKDVGTMAELWEGSTPDESVSEALASGAREEPWAAGSSAFPPTGMRATDRDALVVSDDEGWTTAIERPLEGGTLLATQRWRRVDGAWRIATHRYIPWSADGATAIATLRCDGRGCVSACALEPRALCRLCSCCCRARDSATPPAVCGCCCCRRCPAAW